MTRFEKLTVYSSTIVVALTGFVYAGMKYLMQPADEWAVVNHPLQPWVLKLHILAAPLLVFAIGMIAMRHILPHLRVRMPRGLRTGMSSALIIVPMILSGYLLQAVTSAGALVILGYIHLAAGTLFALTSIGHAAAARRRRAAAAPAAPERTDQPEQREQPEQPEQPAAREPTEQPEQREQPEQPETARPQPIPLRRRAS